MSDYASSQPVRTRTEEELQVITKAGSAVTVAQSVAANLAATVTQSGTVLIKADTLANQTAGPLKCNLRDAADAELKGQKAMASSIPVAIASDQGTLTFISDTIANQTNGPLKSNLRDASDNELVGQKAMASSLPVAIASDQSTIVIKPDTLANQGNGPLKANLRDSADAELIGQKTMSASVPVVLASDQSSIPVSITGESGTLVHDYNTAATIAKDATSTHTYTNATGKTVYLEEVFASASGELRVEVKVGPAASEVSKLVGFTSRGGLNFQEKFGQPLEVPNGQNVLIDRKNIDNSSMDVYSFVNGYAR